MRPALTLLHRTFGLFIAGFLVVSGLTGAVISWDHEIDSWLNRDLFEIRSTGPMKPPLELAALIEAADPRARVTLVPLHQDPGQARPFIVRPRVDAATGRLFALGYNQVFIDPVTGQVQGRREWGTVSLSRENLMPFLYKLHYTLHLPEMWGIDEWGVWLMGGVALVWLVDAFVAIALTWPVRRKARVAGASSSASSLAGTAPSVWRRWWPAWRVRRGGGAYRLNVDLHRAGGLWTWALVLVIAFTAFSLNLYREVFFPAMSLVSKVTPGPFETRKPAPEDQPITPKLGFPDVLAQARAEAARRGWAEPAGNVFYTQGLGVYGVRFFEGEQDRVSGGMAVKTLYYDGLDGRLLGDRTPWEGSAADVFVQLQFPLHSGRILGMPGRIMMSVMGLLVAMLSVTGVVIWWKKRRGRLRHRTLLRQRAAPVIEQGVSA
jgi:uncharacterized iron-regulated membrane protein